MSKIKNGGLDQYGTEPFEPQQFGTAGFEGVNNEKIAKYDGIVCVEVIASEELAPGYRPGIRLAEPPCTMRAIVSCYEPIP